MGNLEQSRRQKKKDRAERTKRLADRLDYIKSVSILENKRRIMAARACGGVEDNPLYEMAKREQVHLYRIMCAIEEELMCEEV